jgi:hypothetical protein
MDGKGDEDGAKEVQGRADHTKLREAEVELAKGQSTPQVCKKLPSSPL